MVPGIPLPRAARGSNHRLVRRATAWRRPIFLNLRGPARAFARRPGGHAACPPRSGSVGTRQGPSDVLRSIADWRLIEPPGGVVLARTCVRSRSMRFCRTTSLCPLLCASIARCR